ncbi:MAG TPA: thermonuclease family protein [Rhodocyclaceae bacterium]|nr:thermonuclease family protein [Rhodocyclaceae bacterium]
MKSLKWSFVLFAVCTLAAGAVAAHVGMDWRPQHRDDALHNELGMVVAVIDGGTLQVELKDRVVNVKLSGIAAPMQGQPLFAESTQSLYDLAVSRQVALTFGRTVGHDIWIASVTLDGIDLSSEQVSRGLARVASDANDNLRHLQAEAQKNDRGLWAPPESVSLAAG